MAAIPTILQVLIAFFGAYFIALWFSMIIWTFYDIRARSQDLYVHIFATALVVVFNVFGLVLYLILRPRETLAEAYERSLEEETLLQEIEERQHCPSCRQRVQPDYLLCPYCHTELKQRCPRCERLLLPRWDICPYCGNSQLPGRLRTPAHDSRPPTPGHPSQPPFGAGLPTPPPPSLSGAGLPTTPPLPPGWLGNPPAAAPAAPGAPPTAAAPAAPTAVRR